MDFLLPIWNPFIVHPLEQGLRLLATPLEGVVGAFFADVGQEVFQGQLLARITNQGLETGQQAAQKEAEVAQSKVNALESEIVSARLEASRARADASRARGEYDRLEKIYRRQQMLFNEGATPKTFNDYREILADKSIDTVFIMTPEHLHYPMMLAALKAGKNIYVETPLAHTIE